MKIFFCVFSFGILAFGIALPSLRDACLECTTDVGKLAAFLMRDEIIQSEVEFFKAQLCTEVTDQKGCKERVDNYWPNMSKVLFKQTETIHLLCQKLGSCTKKQNFLLKPKDLTCDECKKGLIDIGQIAGDKDVIDAANTFFQGPDFCTAQGATDPDKCKEFIVEFVPAALPALGYSIGLAGQDICKMVLGLC